jgi:hypothetical protein
VKRSIQLASLAFLVIAAGCGGGGANQGTTTPAPSSGAVITEEGAATKAAIGYRAASALYGTGADSAEMGLVDKSVGATRGLSLVDLSLARLEALAAREGSGPATKAVMSETIPCSSGGSASLTVDDADDSGAPSNGDSVAFRYDGCREGGWMLDGSMVMTNLFVTGDSGTPARSFGATIGFDALRATDGSSDVRIDGAFSMQASMQTHPSLILEATVAGDFLQATTNGVVDRMSDFSSTLRIDRSAGRYSYAVAAYLDIEGLVLSTPQAFSGSIGAFPSAGTLTVVDSTNASASLVALSSTSVRIDFDGNGDGSVDNSQVRTWSEIAADPS